MGTAFLIIVVVAIIAGLIVGVGKGNAKANDIIAYRHLKDDAEATLLLAELVEARRQQEREL